jgi:probable F420-dependent oxidoreductase
MLFGANLRGITPAALTRFAQTVEQLGFESVWRGDHVILPAGPHQHVANEDGRPGLFGSTPIIDVFSALLFAATVTTNLRVGTAVYLLGLRHPLAVARQMLGVDRLSGGRLSLGVGAGWNADEYEMLGVPFSERGRILDESLTVLRSIWLDGATSFSGKHFAFENVTLEPRPAQKPHPPLLVGGESNAALRRAARFGDGWIAARGTATRSGTPEGVRRCVEQLNELRAANGRDLASPFEVTVYVEYDTPSDHVRALEEAGATRAIVWAPVELSSTANIGRLEHFADRVIRECGAYTPPGPSN